MLDILLFDLQIIMKVVFVVITLLYLVFAVVVVKQVRLMADTIKLQFDKYLIYLSYAHLFAAFIVLLLTLLIL